MHILFTWEQGLGYGHLGHLYPIARLMKAAGHQVTLAVRHMENVWAVRDMPFERVYPAPNVRSASLQQDTRTFSDVIRPGGFANSQMLSACTRGWFQLLETLQPDAMVCDHAYNALFGARARGLPAARLGTGFTVPNAKEALPPLRVWAPHSQAQCAAADAALLQVLQETSEQLHLPPVSALSDVLGYGHEFVASWPELDHLGAQKDRYYYGPAEGLHGQNAPDWPTAAPGLPKVFMYLPGDHPHEKTVLDALSQLGWPTIMHSRKAPQALAPTQYFSAEPVNMDTVLGQADLCISHGSHATSADALRAGCLHVLLPNSFERLILATQLVRQGLAAVPTGNTQDAAALASKLEEIVGAPPANAAALGARYKAYNPRMAAQELYEDMLSVFCKDP
jgi:UDP:flavonoid glycosyltransferase YjiC (YdhE family)